MHFRATLNNRSTLSIGLDLFNGVCQSVSGSPSGVKKRVNITRDIYIYISKPKKIEQWIPTKKTSICKLRVYNSLEVTIFLNCHVLPCAEWSLTFFPYLEILKLLRNDRTGELPHWDLPLAQSFWSVRLCIPTVAMDLLNPRKTRLPNRPILFAVKKKSIESSDLPPNTNWIGCQIPPQS
jgi:hypothetical protein